MQKISAEEVRDAVSKFWKVFAAKSKKEFEDLYFPNSTVFSSTAPRTEPGRLMVARRIRQFVESPVVLKAEIGSMEVQCISANVAIACYVFAFEMTRTNRDKTCTRHTAPFSRATQIFQRDEHGALRIIHEHMSSASGPTVETFPSGKEPV